MGIERTVAMMNGKKTVYETESFTPIIAKIEELSGKKYGESEEITKAIRVVADHNEQLKNNFSPNIITAQIGLQVLKAAVSQINAFVCASEGSLSK